MNRLMTMVVLGSLVGCGAGDDGGGGGGPDGGMGDGGTGDDAGPEPISFKFPDVFGVPNFDDDDGSVRDWDQAPFPSDDDFSMLVLAADRLALAGGDVTITMSGDTTKVRVYRGTQLVLGGQAGAGPITLPPDGADVELAVEFGEYLATARLELTGGGQTATLKLQAAPLIMNHHLQPAEHVWAVRVSSNPSFIASYEAALGNKFTAVPSSQVSGDVWIQDEFEFSTVTGFGGQRLDVVIDSIRDRGLDGYAERAWIGPDTIASTWGSPQSATSYDSFGNLEASPPVTVNGTTYPFGKIYYGRVNNSGLNATLGAFLASQKVQAPFQLPTNWLCVGHVDEISSFLPDPSSPKGFKLVIADVPAAWTLLQSLASGASLSRYGQDHGYPTVGSMLGDPDLVALNNDLQADYLDPIVAKFKAELGLTDADIMRVPSLFERVGGCGGRVAALIPGMVNLISANVDGQTTHVFTADPYFRSSSSTQSTDPVIAAFQQAAPAGLQMHFIDDWNTYHLGLGEVHCGTNVRRTPSATWWTTAQHLMGSN